MGLGLLNLQVIQGYKFKELSNKNCIRLLPQKGCRGRILDREGNVIIDNYLSYDVMVLPQEKEEVNKVLMGASRILNIAVQDLEDMFNENFVAPSFPVAIAKNIDMKKAIVLEELKSDLPGLIIQAHPLRHYPYGKLASHIIGYLNEIDRWRLTKLQDYGYKTKDIVGFGGAEERYDYYLRQEEGGLLLEVDHRGRFVRVLGFKPPQNGKDIQLTLDLKIQKIVEDNLKDKKGCAIIMNPYNGEIIALSNSPSFNPSVFVRRSSSSILNLFGDSDAPLVNRAISGVYPAGSIFKLIVATAALELGKINLSTAFSCPGSIDIGAQEFSCWDTHGKQSLLGAIAHSCNVFFYRTGLLIGAQAIADYAFKFGFSKSTSIDLPYEASGFVPNPLWKRIYRFKSWFDGDTANLAIGQGELLVTPLQVARMTAVFANKGFLVVPHVTRTIDGKDISVYYQNKITRLPIKESTVNYIRQGLKKVVSDTDGTASNLSDLAVSVAGKTGTAQVSRGNPHGWFMGFFPFKDPKFVICVFLENGGSGHAASQVTKQIIETMVKEGLI